MIKLCSVCLFTSFVLRFYLICGAGYVGTFVWLVPYQLHYRELFSLMDREIPTALFYCQLLESGSGPASLRIASGVKMV